MRGTQNTSIYVVENKERHLTREGDSGIETWMVRGQQVKELRRGNGGGPGL